MRILPCTLCLLWLALVPSLALAQGGGASSKPTIAQQMRTTGVASPGYMQGELLKDLKANLEKEFGTDRSGEMMSTLAGQNLDASDVTDLFNGKATRSGMQDMFGAKRNELSGVERALKETVGEKNRKMLFGVIVIVMVADFDLPPDSEFCKQVCASRDEMSEEDLEKILKGNRSKGTMGSCFGLSSKDDQDLMQDVMKRVDELPFKDHPMAESLGMGSPKSFDASKCPKLAKGMPGFGENTDGKAGGLPVDAKLPPCPFAGENLKDLFEPEDSSGG